MFRHILMASVGAIALAGSAAAADLPSRAPAPVYVPAPYSWSGLYIGGQIGYAWGDASSSTYGAAPSLFLLDAPSNYNPQGVIGGVHLGYNLQINQWLLGLEGDVDGTSVSKTVNAGTVYTPEILTAAPAPAVVLIAPTYGATIHSSIPLEGSIRLRAGYAWDRALLYATGGAAFAGVKTTYSDFYGFDSISKTRAGWTVGGGVDYAITDNWSVRAEYRYADFGSYNDYLINSAPLYNGAAEAMHTHLTENRVQVGFSYKFGAAPAPVVAKY